MKGTAKSMGTVVNGIDRPSFRADTVEQKERERECRESNVNEKYGLPRAIASEEGDVSDTLAWMLWYLIKSEKSFGYGRLGRQELYFMNAGITQ